MLSPLPFRYALSTLPLYKSNLSIELQHCRALLDQKPSLKHMCLDMKSKKSCLHDSKYQVEGSMLLLTLSDALQEAVSVGDETISP